ncbi:MAG TPA: glycosyltransferase family A protein [Patescibacteria group bacterium]|nr:glycosyltransferase family A protein [Patescibacteria group bacterium]
MNNNNLTVIIPTLNEAKNLPYLLKDLSNQTFKNFRVIIVDGNSEDNTVKTALKYREKKLSISIVLSSKRNVSFQRNLGAKKSKSDWIVFMDADNRIPSFYLQGLVFYSEMLDIDFISSWIDPDTNSTIDKATANIINVIMDISKNTPNPYILESMILAKKDSFLKLNGFDETIHWHEGGDLLRRARGKRMKFDFIKNPKYKYSFRRLRKSGKFSVLQKVIRMEFGRMLDKNKANDLNLFYPMEGGTFYQVNKQTKQKLQGIVSEMFNNEAQSPKLNWIERLIKKYI